MKCKTKSGIYDSSNGSFKTHEKTKGPPFRAQALIKEECITEFQKMLTKADAIKILRNSLSQEELSFLITACEKENARRNEIVEVVKSAYVSLGDEFQKEYLSTNFECGDQLLRSLKQ